MAQPSYFKSFSKKISTLINPALQAFLPRGSEKINKFNFSLAPQRQFSTFFPIFVRLYAHAHIFD